MNRSFSSLLWLLLMDRVTDIVVARALLERLVPPQSVDADFSDAAQQSAKSLSLSVAIYRILPGQLKDLWRRPAPQRAADMLHSLRDMPNDGTERTFAAAASLLRQFNNDGEAAAALRLMFPDLVAAEKAHPVSA